MSAIFNEASGSLRGTLLRAGDFLGFDIAGRDSRVGQGSNVEVRCRYGSCAPAVAWQNDLLMIPRRKSAFRNEV